MPAYFNTLVVVVDDVAQVNKERSRVPWRERVDEGSGWRGEEGRW